MTEHYCKGKWVKGARKDCFMKEHEVKLQRSGYKTLAWVENKR